MRSTALPLLALAAVLLAGSGVAQDGQAGGITPSGMGRDYVRLDKDRDGTLRRREIASHKELARQWNNLDVNRDGKLDEAEFAQFEPELPSQDSPVRNGAQKN